MATWQLQDAKARFSELVDKAEKEGAQVITRRGVETAVIIPINEWNRLKASSRLTMKEVLLYPGARFDLDELLADRDAPRHREPPSFE
jgi:antitoxin Phd